jgi:hypothetical protein
VLCCDVSNVSGESSHSLRRVGASATCKVVNATERRPAAQVHLELSEEAGHGCMVMLSLLVLPLPMLHAGCDTLLTHQLMLMQLCSPGHPVVSP